MRKFKTLCAIAEEQKPWTENKGYEERISGN